MFKDVSQILFVIVEWYVLACRTSWQASVIGAEEDGLTNRNELGVLDIKVAV